MSNFGNALLSGIGAAAKSGAESIEQGQRQQQAIDAEQRAADLKLDMVERMAAAEELRSTAAARRFSEVVKGKMAGTPLEVAPGDPAPQTAEGMLKKPSLEEATRAALDETLQSDPGAFMAGSGMLAAGNKTDLEERKIESREKIAAAELARKEKADAQRDKESDRRFELMMARIAKSGAGGSKADKSALVQNVEFMRDTLKYSPEKIEQFIFDKKAISEAELTTKILAEDKKSGMGDMTAEQAVQQARKIRAATAPPAAAGKGTPPPQRMKYDPSNGGGFK